MISERRYNIDTQHTGINQSQYSQVQLYFNEYRIVLGNEIKFVLLILPTGDSSKFMTCFA